MPGGEELRQVTQLSDVVFTVVTDDGAMKQVYAGGLLRRARGKLFINCATITPDVHVWVEAKAAKAGGAGARSLHGLQHHPGTPGHALSHVRWPAGGVRAGQAAAGEAQRVHALCRPAGKAAQVKALVNMVMNINTAALAEGLALGDALGLDLAMLREVFSQTGANSQVLKTDGEDMQNREHSCFFSAAHAAKDSGIALKLGKAQGLTLPWPPPRRSNTIAWSPRVWASWTSPGIAELTFKGRHAAATPAPA